MSPSQSPTWSRPRPSRRILAGRPAARARSADAASAAYLDLWANARQAHGRRDGRSPWSQPDPRDKRFHDPEWRSNPFFDFLKQAYLVTSRWADRSGRATPTASTRTPATRPSFYVKQIANAISPSNFILTNPELLRETLASNGENLVRGMKMLAEDIEAGNGDLKIRQSDYSQLRDRQEPRDDARQGGLPATTVAEIIQYAPATETVLKRPLLICPPWINKFYILDLNPEKSFIRWASSRAITVFVISWVNPDERHGAKGLEDYMREGLHRGARRRSRRRPASARSTPSAIASAARCWRHARLHGARRATTASQSATFFATQVDFTYAGDLKVFVDEEQIAARRAAR